MILSFIEGWNKATSNNVICAAASAIWCLVTSLSVAAAAEAANQPVAAPGALSQADDPYLWLEDVTGERALTWARAQNALSTKELEASPDFEPMRKRLLSILDSRERIPYVSKHGAWCYNFWRDEKNARGLWRRTSLEEFKKPQPAWEVVLDVDKLAAEERRTGSGRVTRSCTRATTAA